MAKPADRIIAKVLADEPGATIESRFDRSIRFQLPNGWMKEVVSVAPVHIAGTEIPIDTTWVTADPVLDAPYLWKMVLADYHVYFGPGSTEFDAGMPFRIVDPTTEDYFQFEPAANLQWTNDLNQLENIGVAKQGVAASVGEDTLTFTGAYGSGFDYSVQLAEGAFLKRLTLQNALTPPPAFIINGGNPKLMYSVLFQRSSGVTVWLDGVQWSEGNGQPNAVSTFGNIELRNSVGDTIFVLRSPFATDSGDLDAPPVEYRVRRSGGTYFIEIRLGWDWLQNATYPVILDPTVAPIVAASADDGYETYINGSITYSNSILRNSNNTANNKREAAYCRFVLNVPKDSTINSADITYIANVSNADVDTRLSAYDGGDSAPALTGTSGEITAMTITTAYVDWDQTLTNATGDPVQSPDIATIVAEITSRTGWVSGNYIGIMSRPDGTVNAEADWRQQDYGSGGEATLNVDYTPQATNIDIYAQAGVALAAGANATPVPTESYQVTLEAGSALAAGASSTTEVTESYSVEAWSGATLAVGTSPDVTYTANIDASAEPGSALAAGADATPVLSVNVEVDAWPGVALAVGADAIPTVPSGELYHITHEIGTLGEYDGYVGSATADAAAKLIGVYGMKCVDDLAYGYLTFTELPASGKIGIRFYFDPNGMTFSASGIYMLHSETDTYLTMTYGVIGIQLFSGTPYSIRVFARTDSQTWKLNTVYSFTDEPHYIEALWTKESSDGAADGTIEWWIDGVARTTVTGIDNFNYWEYLTQLRFGNGYSLEALDASDILYLDDIVIRDDDTYIGYEPLTTPATPGTALAVGTTPTTQVSIQISVTPGTTLAAGANAVPDIVQAGTTPPTLVNAYQTVWNTGSGVGSKTIVSNLSLTDGDVCVIFVANEGGGDYSVTENGASSIVEQYLGIGNAECFLFTYVATQNESVTFTVNQDGSWKTFGAVLYHYTDTDGLGNKTSGASASGAPTAELTLSGDNSAVVMGTSDWDATGGTQTADTSDMSPFTAEVEVHVAGVYDVFSGTYDDSGDAGTKTVGQTAPSSQDWGLVAIEVLGQAGGATNIDINAQAGVALGAGTTPTWQLTIQQSAQAGSALAVGNDATPQIVVDVSVSAEAGSALAVGADATPEYTANIDAAAEAGTALATGNDASPQVDTQVTLEAGTALAVGANAEPDLSIPVNVQAETGSALGVGASSTAEATESYEVTLEAGTTLAAGADATPEATESYEVTAQAGTTLGVGANAEPSLVATFEVQAQAGVALGVGASADSQVDTQATLEAGTALATGANAEPSLASFYEVQAESGVALATGADATFEATESYEVTLEAGTALATGAASDLQLSIQQAAWAGVTLAVGANVEPTLVAQMSVNAEAGTTLAVGATASPQVDTEVSVSAGVALATGNMVNEDLIFEDGFETGDISRWSSSTGTGLSVTTNAAIIDTYGLEVDLDDDTAKWVQTNIPNAERHIRVRWYFDSTAITAMADGNAFMMFRGVQGTSINLINSLFRYSGGNYQCYALVYDNIGGNKGTGLFNITPGAHWVEIEWFSDGSTGFLKFWIDNVFKVQVDLLDTTGFQIDQLWMGPWGGNQAATTGEFYLDDFKATRIEFIGGAVDRSVSVSPGTALAVGTSANTEVTSSPSVQAQAGIGLAVGVDGAHDLSTTAPVQAGSGLAVGVNAEPTFSINLAVAASPGAVLAAGASCTPALVSNPSVTAWAGVALAVGKTAYGVLPEIEVINMTFSLAVRMLEFDQSVRSVSFGESDRSVTFAMIESGH